MTLVDALKVADKEFFPNVHEVLKLYQLVLFHVNFMRRLKDWSRSTMNEDRLTGLALLYIHQDKDIDKVNILKKI